MQREIREPVAGQAGTTCSGGWRDRAPPPVPGGAARPAPAASTRPRAASHQPARTRRNGSAPSCAHCRRAGLSAMDSLIAASARTGGRRCARGAQARRAARRPAGAGPARHWPWPSSASTCARELLARGARLRRPRGTGAPAAWSPRPRWRWPCAISPARRGRCWRPGLRQTHADRGNALQARLIAHAGCCCWDGCTKPKRRWPASMRAACRRPSARSPSDRRRTRAAFAARGRRTAWRRPGTRSRSAGRRDRAAGRSGRVPGGARSARGPSASPMANGSCAWPTSPRTRLGRAGSRCLPPRAGGWRRVAAAGAPAGAVRPGTRARGGLAGDADRDALITEAFRMRHPDETHRARLRVEIGRLRALVRRWRGSRRRRAASPAAARDGVSCWHRRSTASRLAAGAAG